MIKKGKCSMTKKIFKISTIAMVFCLLVTAAPAMNADAKAKPKLNKKKITVKVGKTKKLKIKNLKGKKVKWKTSNKKVVKIKKTDKSTVVKLKGKKAGISTITAKIGNKKFTCKVTVKEIGASTTYKGDRIPPSVDEDANPEVAPKESVLFNGCSMDVQFRGLENAYKKNIKWSSSDSSIASIKKKKGSGYLVTVTGNKPGKVTITATVTDISYLGTDKKFGPIVCSCTITVKDNLSEKEVAEQEALFNQKHQEYGLIRNSGINTGHSVSVSYPKANGFLKKCSPYAHKEGTDVFTFFDVEKADEYKGDSSIKVTYTIDGTTPTINSTEIADSLSYKFTSQAPTIKVHVYRNRKLVYLDYYTEGHSYTNDGYGND